MTKADVSVLAVDLGSSNGRGMLGRFDGERIVLEELSRFANGPIALSTGLHWDIPMLTAEVERAIERAVTETGGRLASVGVDTWGVDYGLLDRDGALVGPPFAYRDPRTADMPARAAERIGPTELYRRTGSQTTPINTAYQLMSERGGPRWDRARTMLPMPDLFAYHLTGEIRAERTIASTTQLYDPVAGGWADDVVAALELPRSWFPDLVEAGTFAGPLRREVATRVGAVGDLRLVTVAGHDTASAFAATPGARTSFVISVGTWSLAGVELARPLITDAGRRANLTNEAGVSGTTRYLKNAAGMWLLQQCRQRWGGELDWSSLAGMGEEAPAHRSIFDPDDGRFLAPGDMPALIRMACVEAGYPPPASTGAIVRAVIESMALRFRELVEEMERLLGRELATIRVVGGGARNRLLSRMTADATGRAVIAGPAEATALGNVGVQLMALGLIGGPDELRAVVERSVEVEAFEPSADRATWGDAYGRFLRLVGREHHDVEGDG